MTTSRRPAGPIILVLALSGTAVALNQTLVVPLLPALPALLHTTPEGASWLVTATLLVSAVTTPVLSRLADTYGKRRLMLVCLGATMLGSLVGATSDSLSGLLVARSLQGLAPALIPIGIAAMRDVVPQERVGGGVALMSATLAIGGAIGLPLSGLVYEAFGWQAVFWASLGGAVLVFALVLAAVPDSGVRAPASFDALGAILLAIALVALLLPVSRGEVWGWASWRTGGCTALGVVFLVMWIVWELSLREPLVDVRSMARPSVLVVNAVSFTAGFAMFSNLLVAIQQLQIPTSTDVGFGLNGTEAGLAMLPGGIVAIAVALVAGTLMSRRSPRTCLVLGLVVMGGGYLGRVLMDSSLAGLVIGVCIVSAGISLTAAALPVLVLRAVPVHQSAAATGVNSVLRLVGMAVCSASVAALLAAGVSDSGTGWPTAWSLDAASLVAALVALGSAAVVMLIRVDPNGQLVTEGETPPARTARVRQRNGSTA